MADRVPILILSVKPRSRLNGLPYAVVGASGPNIRLCRVDMEVLVREWFGALPSADLRRPARDLSPYPWFDPWLAPGEREIVNGFKSLKRQVEWLAGRLAVKTLVAACFDSGLGAIAVTVSREPGGAPFLPAFPDHCVSITHAGRFAVAALGLDPSIGVGIDLERLPIPSDPAFLGLAFSARERAVLDPSDPEELARAWTLKEAYLKYIRRGFDQRLHRVELLDGAMLEDGRPAPVRWTMETPSPDHRLAVVWGRAAPPPSDAGEGRGSLPGRAVLSSGVAGAAGARSGNP